MTLLCSGCWLYSAELEPWERHMDFELRFAVVHLPGSFALDLLSAGGDALVLRSGVHNLQHQPQEAL